MRIAVVGLGSNGLAVCASLAAAGHKVFGFEQNGPNAAHGSSRGDTRIFRLTPGEGSIYVALAEAADRGWRLLEQQAGVPIIDRMFGYMAGPPESEFVQSCVRLCKEHGRDYALIDAAGAAAETKGWVRLPEPWQICRQNDCGVIDVPAALGALARKARESGARLAFETPVASPVRSRRLRVDGASSDFDRVVLTAGPWMGGVVPEMALDLTVTRKVLAWFAAGNDAEPPPIMPILCLDDEYGTYAMQTPGGLFKIGLHAIGETAVDPDNVEPVQRRDLSLIATVAESYLPHHGKVPRKSDTCLYSMTQDSNFLIRELASDPRVLCMSCCSGHGFKYAPALGEIALDWVEERENGFLRGFGTTSTRAPAVVGLR